MTKTLKDVFLRHETHFPMLLAYSLRTQPFHESASFNKAVFLIMTYTRWKGLPLTLLQISFSLHLCNKVSCLQENLMDGHNLAQSNVYFEENVVSKRSTKPEISHEFMHGLSARIQEKLFENYSNADLPDLQKPTEVKMGLYVVSIDSITNADMSYTMKFYMRQSWVDKRLKYDWATVQTWNDSRLFHLSEELLPKSILILPKYVKSNMFLPDTFFR